MTDAAVVTFVMAAMAGALDVLSQLASLTDADGTLAKRFVLRSSLTAASRGTRSAKTESHRARARRLPDDEHPRARAIGRRLAREDGRPEQPYDARRVRDWLADKAKKRTD